MSVAIYARVSTTDQDAGMQLAELRRYAEARGFTIAGEFVDHGYSGATSSRPALERLMDDAASEVVETRVLDGLNHAAIGACVAEH